MVREGGSGHYINIKFCYCCTATLHVNCVEGTNILPILVFFTVSVMADK